MKDLSFGQTLKIGIQLAGMKQYEAARVIGIANSNLSAVIHGYRKFSDEQLRKAQTFLKWREGYNG